MLSAYDGHGVALQLIQRADTDEIAGHRRITVVPIVFRHIPSFQLRKKRRRFSMTVRMAASSSTSVNLFLAQRRIEMISHRISGGLDRNRVAVEIKLGHLIQP